jgi:hypothetical protein
MATDPGIKHGYLGRLACEDFLKKNNLSFSNFTEALDSIEKHDNKEYRAFSGRYDILTILSAADDLDAFGFTGIYRYAEIYLARGIEPARLGNMIIDNSRNRFDNLTMTFGFSERLMKVQRIRYNILNDFFNEYDRCAYSYRFGSRKRSGYCGVVDLFMYMLESGLGPVDLFQKPELFSDDPILKWYFDGLLNEYSK